MADKSLTESDWKSFAKSEKLDDPKEGGKDGKALHEAVLKGLQTLARKNPERQDEMLAALRDLVELLNRQVVANAKRKDAAGKVLKDTKGVKDQLHKMLAAAEKQIKEVDALAAKAAEASDEEDSPALLTTKMVPLIRQVRKGDLVLQALIALAGKETVVLISNKAISPARGKLLKEQMANPAGLKFIRGECLYEAQTLTFVVQAPAAGLAKKIKAALLAQTELRMKVRVRGEDPADIDEEGEDDAGQAGAASPEAGTAPVDAGAAFKARLAALIPRIKDAGAAGHPGGADAKRKAGEAGQAAAGKDFAAGNALLDEVEQLLSAPAAGAAAAGAAAAPPAAVVAQLAAQTGKLAAAAAVRPQAAPRAALSQRLQADIAAKPVPAQLAELPAQVAEMVPAFLMSMVSELLQTSTPLAPGDALAAQDQMLGVADTLNAAMRSMRKWEQCLADGEAAGKQLDALDQLKADGNPDAEAEAAGVLETYNAARTTGLAEQARAQQLLQVLLQDYQGLQAAA